jgi:hypothetical protein
MNIRLHKAPVARTLVSAGQTQQIGQALSPLTGPLYGGLSNKVTHLLNLWSGLIGALVGPKI